MSIFLDAIKEFRTTAETHDHVAVAFSGGKESRVVLDLCRKAGFARISLFHFDMVPGLARIRVMVDDYAADVGLRVAHYPHPLLLHALREGYYCDQPPAADAIPEPLTVSQMYRVAGADAGSQLVATGNRRSDFVQRAYHLMTGRLYGWHPIQNWSKADVLAYMKLNGIENPAGRFDHSGVDLTPPSVCWLHDNCPDDFAKLSEWFPYAEAVVKRRDWYGIAEEETAEESP